MAWKFVAQLDLVMCQYPHSLAFRGTLFRLVHPTCLRPSAFRHPFPLIPFCIQMLYTELTLAS